MSADSDRLRRRREALLARSARLRTSLAFDAMTLKARYDRAARVVQRLARGAFIASLVRRLLGWLRPRPR